MIQTFTHALHALHAQYLQYKLIEVQEQHRPRSSGGVFAPRTILNLGIGDVRGSLSWQNLVSTFKLSDLLLRPSEMVASLNLRSLHSSVRNWEVAEGLRNPRRYCDKIDSSLESRMLQTKSRIHSKEPGPSELTSGGTAQPFST